MARPSLLLVANGAEQEGRTTTAEGGLGRKVDRPCRRHSSSSSSSGRTEEMEAAEDTGAGRTGHYLARGRCWAEVVAGRPLR